MAKLKIDDRVVEIDKSATILDAAVSAGHQDTHPVLSQVVAAVQRLQAVRGRDHWQTQVGRRLLRAGRRWN